MQKQQMKPKFRFATWTNANIYFLNFLLPFCNIGNETKIRLKPTSDMKRSGWRWDIFGCGQPTIGSIPFEKDLAVGEGFAVEGGGRQKGEGGGKRGGGYIAMNPPPSAPSAYTRKKLFRQTKIT